MGRVASCASAGAAGTKSVALDPPLGRLTTDLGTRYLADGVGRIVNDVPAGAVQGTAASGTASDCQPGASHTRPRFRR